MIRSLSVEKYLRVARALVHNRRTGESVYPFYASFKLTSRCRFACKFCNIRDERKPDSSAERIKRTLDNLSAASVVLVSFEGGEPLLRKDISELLEYARSKDFYLLFTTSEHHLERYPMLDYARYIDFFHVSIDEGHNNLELFARLPEFRAYGAQLSVQVVVMRETLPALEDKVRRCAGAGANVVVMPAVRMNRTEDFFPDLEEFEAEVRRLKREYPATLYTPDGYFDAIRKGRCSTSSIIIDTDCSLYYPCHILESKGPDLSEVPLMEYLESEPAVEERRRMRACGRKCGWFQYYSTNDFTSIRSAFQALRPALSKRFNRFRSES